MEACNSAAKNRKTKRRGYANNPSFGAGKPRQFVTESPPVGPRLHAKGSPRPKSPIDISIVVRVAFLVRDNVGVKRHYRTLILFLLVGVFGRSAVPPVDLPETTFNEMDSPVNLAPPSQAAPKFGRPVGAAPVEDPPLKAALAFCHAEFIGRRQRYFRPQSLTRDLRILPKSSSAHF